MERAAQPQACKIARLHRTIAKMAIMLDAQTALQEAQWQGMKTWLENREEKWNTYHQDDVLWGRGITDMVTMVVTATEGGQRESEEWKADTDGAGLEASIHPDATQTGGPEKPEERQQSQRGRQLKAKRKPKANTAPTTTPRTTSMPIAAMTALPTPPRQWETVQPRNKMKLPSPTPAPTTCLSLADRYLILRRDEKVPLPNQMDQEIRSSINRGLFHQ